MLIKIIVEYLNINIISHAYFCHIMFVYFLNINHFGGV